jgi:hypothetical protein
MKKVSSPLMRKKKAPIKGFAPDQIALSYFQVKRSEID